METAARSARPRPEEVDVRRAREGDPAAFERLYRSTSARIHTLARRLAGRARADELVQIVYVRAWRKLGTFRGDALFSTWLERLALNAILDERARSRALAERERRAPDSQRELAAAIDRTGDRTSGARAHELDLEAALERLPDGAREVFVLHDVEGQPHAEIARQLGITIGTSKSQLHRARLLLREALGGKDDQR